MALKTGEIIAIIASIVLILTILAISALKSENQDKQKKTNNYNDWFVTPTKSNNAQTNSIQMQVLQQRPSATSIAEKKDDKNSEQKISYSSIHRNIDAQKKDFIPIKTEKISLELNNVKKAKKQKTNKQGQSFDFNTNGKQAKSILCVNVLSPNNPQLLSYSVDTNGILVQHSVMSFDEYRAQLQNLCSNIANINDIDDPKTLATQPGFAGCKELLQDPNFDKERCKQFVRSVGLGANISSRDIPILFTNAEVTLISLFLLNHDNSKTVEQIPFVDKDNLQIKADGQTVSATANGTYRDNAKAMIIQLSGKVEFKPSTMPSGDKQYILSKMDLTLPTSIKNSTGTTSFKQADLDPDGITILDNGNKRINNKDIEHCLNAGHTPEELNR